jgi:O-antigen/teichoic acid export membrane protein
LRRLISYSAYSFVGDAVQFVTYRADMWFVDAYHGPANLGVYALAVTLSQLLWILPSAVSSVVFPYVPGLDRKTAADLAWRVAKLTGLGSAALALVGCLLSFLVVPAVFGEGFRAAPRLMVILVFGIVPYAVAKVLAGYLSGIGALGWNLALASAGLVVCIGFDVALIPRRGAQGAAFATALAYSAHTFLQILLFKHKSGLRWSMLFASPLTDIRFLRAMGRPSPTQRVVRGEEAI